MDLIFVSMFLLFFSSATRHVLSSPLVVLLNCCFCYVDVDGFLFNLSVRCFWRGNAKGGG